MNAAFDDLMREGIKIVRYLSDKTTQDERVKIYYVAFVQIVQIKKMYAMLLACLQW